MKKAILLLIFIATAIIGKAQWVSQTSGTVDYLTSVYFPNTNVGYISANGYLLKTTNGGANWTTSPGSGMYNGSPLYFTSIDTGYACGMGGVLKTTDGGLTWIDNFPFINVSGTQIHFPTKNTGYAVCSNASIDSMFTYKTINAGVTWLLMDAMPMNNLPSSLFFSDAMTGSIVIDGVGIYKTIDGGVTWTPKLTTFSGQMLTAIHFPSSNVGYAVGYDSVFKTTDMGETWNPVSYPFSTAYYSIYFTDIDTGFIAGGDGFSTGVIYKTTNGGLNWTLSNTNAYTFNSIQFPTSNTGYACGQSGIIYKYTGTSGINDFEQLNGISIFPNPSNGKFKLSIDNMVLGEKYDISIIDVLGNVIQQKELNSVQEVDISNKAKGIYFVKVQDEKEIAIKKIIVE